MDFYDFFLLFFGFALSEPKHLHKFSYDSEREFVRLMT